ncbi:hypothetical protein NP493_1424g00019 [Ridgeia piscesae]|uniref:UspA domain-containing protein n=1 Tax=Ridgeia piscesae TaxID=27915 RepID=A0AAD9K518_RIDPI|nr:hypothetical protein NP493_1424g00019 [Ridgeia piscesae]
MVKVVLIPIDWSEHAEKAFNWYIYNLHRDGNTLILAHFIDASNDKELEEKELHMLELQEVYETCLLKMKIEYRWIHGSAGSAGEYIVRTTKETGAEMIVLGARGLGKIRKALLGSVSDYVVNKAKVPVLICKWGD